MNRNYLFSLPERLARSVLGLSAGVVREVGEVALPDGVRHSQLYRNVVDTTLRFLIENVGGAHGVYDKGESLPEGFLVRRTAGNAIEALGLVAFRASPVWVLAALADVCGMGRQLIPEIAQALKEQKLLDDATEFTSMDQLLDGLERTSARLASTVNTPPLDVAALRAEWSAIRQEASGLPAASLPTFESIGQIWSTLTIEAASQKRSIFETSSILAISTIQAVPEGARWLSASARVGATRTGRILAAAFLDHYKKALEELRNTGYAAYASRHLKPYLDAAVGQFSPAQRTLTEQLLDRLEQRSKRPSST